MNGTPENLDNNSASNSTGWDELAKLKWEAAERVGHDINDPTEGGRGLRTGYFEDRDLLGMKHQEYRLTKDQIIQDDLSVGDVAPIEQTGTNLTVTGPESTALVNVEDRKNNDAVKARKSEIKKRLKEIGSDRSDLPDDKQAEVRELIAELNDIENRNRQGLIGQNKYEQIEGEGQKVIGGEERLAIEMNDDEAAMEIPHDEVKALPVLEREPDKPLTVVDVGFDYDSKELAHDLAEKELNGETGKSGLIGKLWKGTLFKKYFEMKYTKEFLDGKRTVEQDGKQLTVDELIKKNSSDTIARFVMGATDSMEYIHQKIGKDGKNGEKLTEADAKTTERVKNIIEKFATAKIPEGKNLEDLKREFYNDIGRMRAEARDNGEPMNEKMIGNYYEVAIQARERAEHGVAIERVMEGFKVYNGEARSSVRTEAHRDNIDKIVNAMESSAIGRVIPPEILAGALGVAAALTQTGARTLAGAAGGVVVSGVMAGLKERNRVTEDRARMARDVAMGLGYGDKQSKYEKRLGGTIYDMQSAKDLTENITKAVESGDEKAILQAITEAEVRIEYSDANEKDLISYSGEEKIGSERLALDKAVIEATKGLSDESRETLTAMKENLVNQINKEVDEKDKDFKRVRAAKAMKQAGKTIAIGAVTFFASQEVMAALDPGKIGILEKTGMLEKAGIRVPKNNIDAEETILAGLAGPRIRTETSVITTGNVSGNDKAAIEKYAKEGYTKTVVKQGYTERTTSMVETDPANSINQANVKYDGWANNGTKAFDGNELRAHIENGKFVSTMRGNSTMAGKVFNYDELMAADKIKAYVTVGGAKFEVVGKMGEWGENGVFTTTTGETIKAIGNNGEKLYKYFEIVVDNGVDASGVQHIIPLATDVGKNTFAGKLSQVVEKAVEHPEVLKFTKTITKEIPRGVWNGGIAIPLASREGISAPERRKPESQSDGGEIVGAPGTSMVPVEEAERGTSLTANETGTNVVPISDETGVIRSRLENRKELFGGDEGVSLIIDNAPYDDEIDAEKYEKWWNELSDGARILALREIMRSDRIGNGLKNWLSKHVLKET